MIRKFINHGREPDEPGYLTAEEARRMQAAADDRFATQARRFEVSKGFLLMVLSRFFSRYFCYSQIIENGRHT